MHLQLGTRDSLQTIILKSAEVLAGYEAVSALYPHVPPLSHWRAWERAAYQHYRLNGRVLDVGCGDGLYFRLIWPEVDDVIGVDMDPVTAERGRQSKVYRVVHVAPAHAIPEADASVDNAFANCSLEHMANLDGVLLEVQRCLKPGGALLCSVVTNRLVDWAVLPALVAEAGFEMVAEKLQKDFLDYHHLVNPLSVEAWLERFEQAGFRPESHIPILPMHNSAMFVLMDSLWHVKRKKGGEIGDIVYPLLASNEKFPSAFREIIRGLLEMESDWHDCSGAVFSLRKPGK